MTIDLKALRDAARLPGLTPSPWEMHEWPKAFDPHHYCVRGEGGDGIHHVYVCEPYSPERNKDDLRFIAVAHPAAVLAILDRLESAERRAEEAEKERDEAVEEVRLLSTHCNGLDEQLAAVEKDAERYRWLRTPPHNIDGRVYGPTGGLLRRDEYLDAAIDAAMAQEAFNPNSVELHQIKGGAETASEPAPRGVDAEDSGGAGMAQEGGK